MSKERIAVVTGASRGLGIIIAQEFAANNWQVVGIGRSERPNELTANIGYSQIDASDAGACEKFWQELAKKHPEAEFCLVNNAGGYIGGSLAKSNPEDFTNMMQSCYFTAVNMTRSLVLAVSEARIINVISAGALATNKNQSAYGAAKAAEAHFFQALQKEFAAESYRITNLYPDNIASHGAAPHAIDSRELAAFILEVANANKSFYLPDVTISAL